MQGVKAAGQKLMFRRVLADAEAVGQARLIVVVVVVIIIISMIFMTMSMILRLWLWYTGTSVLGPKAVGKARRSQPQQPHPQSSLQ